MALFFTQNVLLANGHLKKPMNLLFEFAFYVLAHCHLMCISPVIDSEFWCLSSCIKYIYIFMCLTLAREGSLPICTTSVLCSWLVFVNLIYIFFHANWRQNITAALTCTFVIMCFFHLTGFMVICLRFPYGLTFSFLCIKHCLVFQT